MALFGRPKYTIVRLKKKEIPDGLWTKCEACSETLYNKTIEENLKVCPKCDCHFSLGAYERINMLIDRGTFQEYDKDMLSADPLDFKGPKTYKDKLAVDQLATGLKDAVISGEGFLDNKKTIIAVTDSRFIMGSMGSVVGEKITRAIESATRERLPLIIVSGSGGGARMYEGMFSLMQMSKTCAALSYHRKAMLPYISVLTNPTMGGVMASFAGIGDIIIAEPKALIGFAGPRVIEQTIRQKLPPGFQRSEFLLAHGLIDMIVHRKNLKTTLSQLLDYLT
ncbi:MAG: acetyl-CoA carboxylase carboxyl transferase subunit beta [Candidatus Omnitrophica bacterium CG08_land_8_20_14_0_20_41_16]|uniref:Acetyl-coenzyme A carboxylase carboxyl transferase subunit beta n=1 Tax=Candidatus Sherwoodlollariibacterium unditelluris TaxID=1974757 RepID=A0A2G9YKV6_9BACT|nr:MAG: acetyl-CoA carboxylase carboxyl transferase subunit beta [Candidatus Omnitrophica bacterium CG23_combo_of_CG06-09_8_20_14_all_41_10]PIS33498.1 MAG: acetyl-CoA carboxylase carboxyl transferase subunit beta [Candidatus Omnitrophica bacterium CG08_land_8_20_14_0_20_41_16]